MPKRVGGTYTYKGTLYVCDCETQMLLYRHYLAANIGVQYQRLDWADFRDQEVRESVTAYLANWEAAKLQGMGLEFSSPQLGTGKTFAATHVGKELVKRGEKVYFYPFLELISLYQRPIEEREDEESRLRNSTVLILDEVLPPHTSAQKEHFAAKLEELVRFRTNFNRVTIMTTNLTPERLMEVYPRPYSLLEAKQFRFELEGDDARRGEIKKRNLSMIGLGEVAPIT
jgi:DNA replication protein DnaC